MEKHERLTILVSQEGVLLFLISKVDNYRYIQHILGNTTVVRKLFRARRETATDPD